MTGQEIIKKLNDESLEISKYDFADDSDDLAEEVFGKSTLVVEEGGWEGQGEYVERVRHFIDHNVYIRLIGFYTSYHGTDYDDDYEEVKPAQKTITVYE